MYFIFNLSGPRPIFLSKEIMLDIHHLKLATFNDKSHFYVAVVTYVTLEVGGKCIPY